MALRYMKWDAMAQRYILRKMDGQMDEWVEGLRKNLFLRKKGLLFPGNALPTDKLHLH